MNGQRAPFMGPSESHPQESAMTMKMAVVGKGTDFNLAVLCVPTVVATYDC